MLIDIPYPTGQQANDAVDRALEAAKIQLRYFSLTNDRGTRGYEDEHLGARVFVIGNVYARHTIWITNGLHGPERFAGAGFIEELLANESAVVCLLGSDVRILVVEGANPFGNSFYSRFNEDMADPNRNFRRHFPDKVLPLPKPYRFADEDLNPTSLSWWKEFWRLRRLYRFWREHGDEGVMRLVGLGQRSDPRKLLFVGFKPTWTRNLIESVIRDYSFPLEGHDVHIDIHTGLGKRLCLPRQGPLLVTIYGDGSAELDRARRFFGEGALSATGNKFTLSNLGTIENAFFWNLPSARTYTGVCCELGSEYIVHVIRAVRRHHCVLNYRNAWGWMGRRTRRQVGRMFNPLDRKWREDGIAALRQLLCNAIDNLKKEIAP